MEGIGGLSPQRDADRLCFRAHQVEESCEREAFLIPDDCVSPLDSGKLDGFRDGVFEIAELVYESELQSLLPVKHSAVADDRGFDLLRRNIA